MLLSLAPVTAQPSEQAALHAEFREFVAETAADGLDLPLAIRSREHDGVTYAEVSGVFEQPFAALSATLADATHWCEFLPLNFNIKSCTHHRGETHTLVTLYAGRKHYQTPDEAHQLEYRFHVAAQEPSFLKVVLSADDGPMGLRQSRIELAAMPVAGDRSFVRVELSQESGFVGRLAARSYLATLGKDKVGFSVEGRTPQGEPILVKGMQGMIERNAVRYFLAMRAQLASLALPAPQRLDARLRLWFDFTERYPEQLREMERGEYRRTKLQEWENQRRLQQTVAPAAPTGAAPQP